MYFFTERESPGVEVKNIFQEPVQGCTVKKLSFPVLQITETLQLKLPGPAQRNADCRRSHEAGRGKNLRGSCQISHRWLRRLATIPCRSAVKNHQRWSRWSMSTNRSLPLDEIHERAKEQMANAATQQAATDILKRAVAQSSQVYHVFRSCVRRLLFFTIGLVSFIWVCVHLSLDVKGSRNYPCKQPWQQSNELNDNNMSVDTQML